MGQRSSQNTAWPAGAMASEGGRLINGCMSHWPLSGHSGGHFSPREGKRLHHWDVPELWPVGIVTGATES